MHYAIRWFKCKLKPPNKYRVKFEVMGIDTPNLLSRETTFLMGILKKCLVVETPKLPSSDIPSSYIPSSENPSQDMKGAFSHSVSSMEMIPLIAGLNQLPSFENSSQDMKSTSVPPTNQLPSSENPSWDMEGITVPPMEMNSTSTLQMTNTDSVLGQSIT